MNKDCVINPKTGRAVKIGSVAGKKVMKTDPTPTHDCVINPKTGRAVKKTGALGKKLVGASTTINQAVKMKIARKNVEKAKVETKPKTPQKKKDTNRLHNLPEDLQKKIMEMARPVTPRFYIERKPKPAPFIPYQNRNETKGEWLKRLFEEAKKQPTDDRLKWFMNLPNTSLPQAFTYMKLFERQNGR
jgi:hypothetical protein